VFKQSREEEAQRTIEPNTLTLELTTSGGKPHTPFCLRPKERKQAMIWL
jgi:hypothetical protein